MRTIHVGVKQGRNLSKASLGTKVYGGIKSLGQKVYDNRWKLISSAGAAGASAAGNAALKYLSGSSGPGENNIGQTLNFPSVPRDALPDAYRFNRGSV